MRTLLLILCCLSLLSVDVFSQDVPLVSGEDANILLMLDDITQSLSTDDHLSSGGLDATKSLLDDLDGGTPSEDPISPDSPGDPGGDPGTVPIDGGLSLLFAAGVSYGLVRVKGRK